MKQRSSATARAIAVAALACGFVVVIAVVAASLGDGGDGGPDSRQSRGQAAKRQDEPTPRSYVVQNGDTLTSIGHETGVPVSRIQELNPDVDPQILVSGEKLKLR